MFSICLRAMGAPPATAVACSSREFGDDENPALQHINWRSCKVAVVGAGAAGLVTARELVRQGHTVVVYEQSPRIGGVWAYDPRTEEEDLLGRRPDRARVHGSMYSSLRTNLPREIMSFLDYPFVAKPNRDPRRFPGHGEVLAYLEDFARDFGLLGLVRLCTEVVHVQMDHDEVNWVVRSKRADSEEDEEEFEAVVVCNGHYSEPRVADIPGIGRWPGRQIHSHNYRTPEQFKDQVVIVIGNSSSGEDISKELANVAKEVHLCAKSWSASVDLSKPSKGGKLWQHLMVDAASEDGTVHFQDGTSIIADVILHCTGYSYNFPFLDTNDLVKVEENRVGPLYEHVFPPALAPSLSFVGLPFKVITFPFCEVQAKWIASVLSGRVALPSEKEMMRNVGSFYDSLEEQGIPKRYTHNLDKLQFEYCDWLAKQCGCSRVDVWRREIYFSTRNNKRSNPDSYRDTWSDEEWLEVAMASTAALNRQNICYMHN